MRRLRSSDPGRLHYREPPGWDSLFLAPLLPGTPGFTWYYVLKSIQAVRDQE